jgi:hypothetical protein
MDWGSYPALHLIIQLHECKSGKSLLFPTTKFSIHPSGGCQTKTALLSTKKPVPSDWLLEFNSQEQFMPLAAVFQERFSAQVRASLPTEATQSAIQAPLAHALPLLHTFFRELRSVATEIQADVPSKADPHLTTESPCCSDGSFLVLLLPQVFQLLQNPIDLFFQIVGCIIAILAQEWSMVHQALGDESKTYGYLCLFLAGRSIPPYAPSLSTPEPSWASASHVHLSHCHL